ncbi:c-type cytochrome [Novosphingobium sediminicola]|uniref:Cytochrome c domain-containing protein n=1 Tax=Novosphingobium sediminicola TaxID=563162 RepID=A0A7W6CDZ5_9SPHN|nr:cytochrome c [Novosphingobium sediminicola]MBB3953730.1 hypothetical protein [Novosphingobium sediminicola]
MPSLRFGRYRWLLALLAVVGIIWIYYAWTAPAVPAWRKACGKSSGKVVDEAVCAYRQSADYKQAEGKKTDADLVAASWKAADEDYFADMDRAATKDPVGLQKDLAPFVPGITPEEAHKVAVIGRNNWIVWTAGNDRFWDVLATKSFGNVDLLKTVSSFPGAKFGRDNRWEYLGLVNEPCFEKAPGPDPARFGLYLDRRKAGCQTDPFENEVKYPGVKLGARGQKIDKDGTVLPVGSLYGAASGVVGLRLFPNPDFDAAAKAKWDWRRYYTDPTYYNDKNLIRPYRVGMACAFCHVGPSPTNPPKDPENPEWANLNSNPGAQYFWIDRIFGFDQDYSNYIFQLYHTSRPGALDTSLVSSDFINNPRTMNAIYAVGTRARITLHWGKEKIAGAEQGNRQFNEYLPANSPLSAFYKVPDTVFTPRVLKDGSDSVGMLGALNRVYINIGLFSEEWITHFNPVVGGTGISPISIAVGRKNSAYWVANESQTPDVALFFLATAKPDYLSLAPGGSAYLSTDKAGIEHGKEIFAGNCAACHSSKLPAKAQSFFPDNGCNGKNYLTCWNNYWRYTRTDPQFRSEMTQIVKSPDFLEDNFLSTDQRVPVTLLETNICSPIATNAIKDNIWDNFSSASYKELPSVGEMDLHDPYTGQVSQKFTLPGGGRGFTRPASLISLWSSAPFLQNNTVGPFNPSPSLESRNAVFDVSIRQMLWPEKRGGNVMFRTASGAMLPGQVDVTTKVSYIRLPNGYLPRFAADALNWFAGTHFITDQGLRIGPIPAGTPINLFSNLDLDVPEGFWAKISHFFSTAWTVLRLTWTLHQIDADDPPAVQSATFRKVAPRLISASKCPDYIVNRGHYFGTQYLHDPAGAPVVGLSDAEKEDLIKFLKTL